MQDLEDKMENMLTTVDKLFRVELMKMPPSLKDARVGDVLSGRQRPLFYFIFLNKFILRKCLTNFTFRLCS